MSKRHVWGFKYVAQSLLNPARAKLEYHRERLGWWEGELKKADAELREKGIEIRDQAMTGGNRAVAVLDPAREARVSECRSKRDSHKDSAEKYDRWLRIFEANPTSEVELDFEDMEFFGL